jgi:2-polyprenyl-6-methoxyphenol hydroxylase-like FAD-dependent oxidoreductase
MLVRWPGKIFLVLLALRLKAAETYDVPCGDYMKILISGAGPAGLIAAYWLRRYGFHPSIVERAPSLSVGGYKIDVRGAALQVLRQMGVHDAVVAAHTNMQGALLVEVCQNPEHHAQVRRMV